MTAKPTIEEKFLEVADWLEHLATSLTAAGEHLAALKVSEAMDKVNAAAEECEVAAVDHCDYDWKPGPESQVTSPSPEAQHG